MQNIKIFTGVLRFLYPTVCYIHKTWIVSDVFVCVFTWGGFCSAWRQSPPSQPVHAKDFKKKLGQRLYKDTHTWELQLCFNISLDLSLFLSVCRKRSQRSVSLRRVCLRIIMWSTRPRCTASMRADAPGSSDSIKKDSSWRETGSRKLNRVHTSCPDPLKVRTHTHTHISRAGWCMKYLQFIHFYFTELF